MQNSFYLFSNPKNDKYVAVGCTRNVDRTLRNINENDFRPFPFRLYAHYACGEDITCSDIWLCMDNWFSQVKYIEMSMADGEKVRFYELTRERVMIFMNLLCRISDTVANLVVNKNFSDEQSANTPGGDNSSETTGAISNQEEYIFQEKESSFCFSDCKIRVGETITYKYNQSVKATVYDDKHVLYDGEVMKLTTLARKVAGRDSKNGPRDFLYKGLTLASIRKNAKDKKE